MNPAKAGHQAGLFAVCIVPEMPYFARHLNKRHETTPH